MSDKNTVIWLPVDRGDLVGGNRVWVYIAGPLAGLCTDSPVMTDHGVVLTVPAGATFRYDVENHGGRLLMQAEVDLSEAKEWRVRYE